MFAHLSKQRKLGQGTVHTHEPAISRNTPIDRNEVNHTDTHNNFASLLRTRVLLIHDRNDKLRNSADDNTPDDEVTTADAGDEEPGEGDGDDSDGGENARVLEGLSDTGHFEEVRAVGDEIHGSAADMLGRSIETERKRPTLLPGWTLQRHSAEYAGDQRGS